MFSADSLRRTINTRVSRLCGFLLFFSPPFVAECIRGSRVKWVAVFDSALEVLRARDIPHDIPLIGVFSRFGWSHPGPAVYYFLALPSKLFRDPSAAVAYWTLGSKWLLVAAVSTAISSRIGVSGASILGATYLYALLNSPESVWSYWNPVLAAAAFGALLAVGLFCWTYERSLAASTLLASVAVQLHIGTLLPSLAVLIVLITARLVLPRHDQLGESQQTSNVFQVGVVLLWLAPLWDQLFHKGNLSKIVHYFFESNESRIGIATSSRILAKHLLPWAPWSGGVGFYNFPRPSMSPLFLLVPTAACIMLAITARRNEILRAPALGLPVVILASLVAMSQTTGTPWPYLHAWIVFLSATLWGTVLLAVARSIKFNRFVPSHITGRILLSVSFSLVLIAAPLSVRRQVEFQPAMKTVQVLTPTALALVPEGTEFTFLQADFLVGVGTGIAFQLEINDRKIRVDRHSILTHEQLESAWGPQRLDDNPPEPIIAVVQEDLATDFIRQGFKVRASHRMSLPRNSETSTHHRSITIYLMSRGSVRED